MADLVKKLDEQGLKTLISLIKGDNKEIGPEFVSGTLNTNIVHGTGNRLYINDETSGNNNIVSGKNNTVLGVENLVTGLRNTIHKTSQVAKTSGTTTNYIEDAFVNYIPVCNNIVGGSDNVVAHNCNIISGNANHIYGQGNIVNGTSNRVQTIKLNNRSGKHNIVNGTNHFIEGRTGLIIGESNNSYNTSERSIICGQGNTNYGQNNILLGHGNSAQGNNQIVLGTYNVADDNTAIQGDNFAITNQGEFKGTKYFVKNTEAILPPLDYSEILYQNTLNTNKTRSFNHKIKSTSNFNNSVILACGYNIIDGIPYNAIVVTGSIFSEIEEEKTYWIIINELDILKIEKIEPHTTYGQNYKLYYKPTSKFYFDIKTNVFKSKVNSIRFITEEYLWQTDIKASKALEQANTYTDEQVVPLKNDIYVKSYTTKNVAGAKLDYSDGPNLTLVDNNGIHSLSITYNGFETATLYLFDSEGNSLYSYTLPSANSYDNIIETLYPNIEGVNVAKIKIIYGDRFAVENIDYTYYDEPIITDELAHKKYTDSALEAAKAYTDERIAEILKLLGNE